MSFLSDTEVKQTDDRTFTAHLDARWSSLVGVHGGYSAAVVARAMEKVVDDPDRPLRTITTHFAAPPEPGEVSITVEIERSGRSMTVASARMTQGDRLLLIVRSSSSVVREGRQYDDRQQVPGEPGDTPIFEPPAGVSHFQNAEIRLDPNTVPFTNSARARVAAWIRPLDGEEIDAAWLTAMCDILPPAVFVRSDGPSKAASIDYYVHLVTGRPTLDPGRFVYLSCLSEVSNEGFAVEDATVWAPTGEVLALARQTRLAG